jgi:RHS repeat-associated protein
MTDFTTTGGTVGNFTYTGLGQSELTQSSQTTFQNSSIGVAASTFSGTTTYYTHDNNGQLVSERVNGSEYFPAFDGIGSTTALVDGTGAVAATWVYNAYGKLVSSSGSTGVNRFRFAGGWQDGTTNYYHFGDRWYDPGTGRWTQQDPVAHIGDLTQGDAYAYAGGNPVNYTDPSGRTDIGEILAGVITIVGADMIGSAVLIGSALLAPEALPAEAPLLEGVLSAANAFGIGLILDGS